MSGTISLDASWALDGLERALDRFIANLGTELAARGEQTTLRDRFAMAALEGILAGREGKWTHERAASEAYAFADAMLAARAVVAKTEDPAT